MVFIGRASPVGRAALPRLVKADERQLEALMTVMRAAFDPGYGEAWSALHVAGTLSDPNSFARLADGDDGPAGFTLCRRAGPEVELLLIAVAPMDRGRGLGRLLLDTACADAQAWGAVEIFLEVRENNQAARRLYGQAGFQEVGRRRDYYAGSAGVRYAAVTMRRLLAN